jgi:VWFA-related protein
MMYRILIASVFVAAALQTPVLRAQDKPAPPEVTFQVEVNYVDVDVVVTDENGKFVPGLTRDDFQVFEDGKPQKVETFAYVEIPVVQDNAFVLGDRQVSTDSKTNRVPFSGRLFVIVLDDQDVASMRTAQVKKSAKEFVAKYMGANDIAAVVHTSGRTDASQEFTSNKALLNAAIDKFVGRRMRSLTIERLDAYYQNMIVSEENQSTENQPAASTDPGGYGRMEPSEFERGFRAVGVLDTLRLTAEFLSSVRGRRKAILFFSEGIDYPIQNPFGGQSASDVIRATQDAITMAARANVNFHTIDPRGLVGMTNEFMEMAGSGAPELAGGAPMRTATGEPITGLTGGTFNAQSDLMTELMMSQGSLRELAEQTGGIAAVNTNSLTDAYNRIMDANSRYYVLGYYPPTQARDGRFHRIEVKTKRPGVRIMARRGYGAPRGRTAEEKKRDDEARRLKEARRPNADKTTSALRDLLTSPLQQSGLNFTVQAAPFKNTQKEASVALAIEIDGDRLPYSAPDAKGISANKIELSYYGLNEMGKALAGTHTVLDLTLKPETRDRVKTFGIRVNPRINLPPGRYHMRIGAREAVGGLMGSVFYDLEVPDFRKEKLMLGGLALASASGQETPSIQADPVLSKVLPAAATSRREFTRRDVLALYTEVYDNIGSDQSRRIDIAARLVSENGTEVFVVRDEIANGGVAPKKPWDIYGYATQIALKGIEPGRYALRVEAQVRGNVGDAKPFARETLIRVVP